MSLVGLASVRGAPGVTTTSMLVAGALSGSAVMVEADLAGGVLAARYGLGREPGLTTLAATSSQAPSDWRAHAQDAGGVAVLVGPDSPANSRSLWRRAGDQLARSLNGCDATVVADLGRLTDATPLLDDLALLVVLVRPIAEHLVTLSHHLSTLNAGTPRVRAAVVLVDDGDYGPSDIAGPLDVDVLATLPHDSRTAEVFSRGGSATGLGRSRLVRAISGLATTLEAMLAQTPEMVEASQ